MKKKMERLGNGLFQLTAAEQKRITGGFIPVTETAVTAYETYTSTGGSDFARDGDNE
jgi:hypothetical protein